VSAPTFDLQSHSTRSDGSLEPADVVARAAAAGVRLLALTDHDAVDGVDEAIEAGRAHAIRVVPAAELSALDGEREDLHVLGYAFDHHAPGLRDALVAFRADRNARGARMADALEALGFALDRGPLDARSAAGAPIGRPHLAAAVLRHPDNAARLRAEGLHDPGAVLEAYLVAGAPAYRRRTTPTIAEAIALIHDAGGVAVWAHPFWDLDDDADVLDAIDRFVALGLDGVEAFYVTHTAAQTHLVADRCEQLGLLTTGSADFHGPGHERFNAFRAFDLHGHQPRLGPIAAGES
jgi:predicted metal-dependent phosphoesterase TrpH